MKYIFFIFIFFSFLYSETSVLTQKEEEWIKNNNVKVAITDLYPLSYLNKNYQRDGFVNDILELIIKKYNINVQTVDFKQKYIKKAFKKNEIDLIPIIDNKKSKNNFATYSNKILEMKRILFIKKDQKNIDSFDDLNNKKVAVTIDDNKIMDLKKDHSNIEVIKTNNIKESITMLLTEKVDALIASPIIIQKFLEQNLIIDLKAIPSISFEPSNLYFLINKNKPILESIIKKGLNSISIKEKKELFDKWFLKELADLPIVFTKEELNYLHNKSSINLCVDPDWMPYEKIEGHKHIGIVADYMQNFQKKIGVPLKLVETKNWTQSLEYVKNRNCDILSLLINTKERQRYMNFTKPYIVFSLVLVTKRNVNFISDLKELEGKKIGIQKNYAYTKTIKNNYQNLEIIKVNNLKDGLKKVERGELFGQVATYLSVAYAFQDEFYGSLQISGKFDEKVELSLGVRNDDPILLNIFEKVVNYISKETRQKIISKWVSVESEKSIDYKLFWSIIGFLVFVLLLILYTYIIQRKYLNKVKKVKQEIEILNSTLERKVQDRTKEVELSNKKLVLKTRELEELNNNLDIKIKKEIENRKKQEQLLIQQSKLAEMGEMISMIAHQWRQPLSALGTIVQNIHLRYSLGKLDDEYMENQRVLSNALTKKMSKTIDDFRNFFKPNKEKESFSIKEAINQTIFLIDDSFKSNNIEIDCKISDDILVYGYESELSQVLLNILINSKDAFLENNIENPSIKIKTKKIQTHVKILISDNAGGISRSIINKIFEPYFTTKTSYNGTGLGLYMSKIIIEENMLGELKVKNIENGVEFSIYIPIK